MLNWDDYHTDEAIQPRSTAAKPAPEIVEQAIEAAAQEHRSASDPRGRRSASAER